MKQHRISGSICYPTDGFRPTLENCRCGLCAGLSGASRASAGGKFLDLGWRLIGEGPAPGFELRSRP